MVVEGPFGQVILPNGIQWAARPKVADVLERDMPVTVDDIDQPNVPVEIVLCHIGFFWFYKYTNKNCHNWAVLLKSGRFYPRRISARSFSTLSSTIFRHSPESLKEEAGILSSNSFRNSILKMSSLYLQSIRAFQSM